MQILKSILAPEDKFSEPFKLYLGKDSIYNFISSIIKESKCCIDLIKNVLKKNLKCNV